MGKQNLIQTFTEGRGRLRSLARRFLGNDSDADDVVQDAFLRLWSHAEGIKNQQHSDSSAMLTVRNLSIDRKRKDKMQNLSDDAPPDITDEANEGKEQLLSDVEAIIEQELTTQQRQIIHLREYEDKEYDEIATMLGMQPTAVRMQLSRARKRIREIYQQRNSESK